VSLTLSRWTLCTEDANAVCVSLVMIVKSSVTEISTVVSGATKSAHLKFVTGIPHSQEYERMVGLICMMFNEKKLAAQLSQCAITFGTLGYLPEKIPSKRGLYLGYATKFRILDGKSNGNASPLKDGVASGATSTGAPRASSDRTTLDIFDTSASPIRSQVPILTQSHAVPVYDARGVELNLDQEIDNLDSLPLFEDFGGEIPSGSCALVGYTVTKFVSIKAGPSVSFNVQWLAVLGVPE
jgi:hypothetical protein